MNRRKRDRMPYNSGRGHLDTIRVEKPVVWICSLPDYFELKTFFVDLYFKGIGPWPQKQSDWPKPDGCPSYTVYMYFLREGGHFITIKFETPILLPNGIKSDFFRIGHSDPNNSKTIKF